jgi:hypothetical protein
VPRVETTTSLAAKPPTRAMFVRQSNPASTLMLSRLRPIRPASECLRAAEASSASMDNSRSFTAWASAESSASSPDDAISTAASSGAAASTAVRSSANCVSVVSGSRGKVIKAQSRIEMARITVPAFLIYCQVRSQVWIRSPFRVGSR